MSIIARIRAFLLSLFAASVWSANAFPQKVPPEQIVPRYMRRLVRLWLPLYDIFIIFTGTMGVIYGSPLLFRLYDPMIVDIFTSLFLVSGLVALLGVGFPRFETLEAGAKLFVLGMVVAYIVSIIFFGAGPDTNWFVVGMLGLGLPLLLFRLDMIADNARRRRQDAEVSAGRI